MGRTWVVLFDCGEALIAAGLDERAAWSISDDLGCAPVGVYPPARVVLKNDPWTKNGQMRCQVARVLPEALASEGGGDEGLKEGQ